MKEKKQIPYPSSWAPLLAVPSLLPVSRGLADPYASERNVLRQGNNERVSQAIEIAEHPRATLRMEGPVQSQLLGNCALVLSPIARITSSQGSVQSGRVRIRCCGATRLSEIRCALFHLHRSTSERSLISFHLLPGRNLHLLGAVGEYQV